MQVMPTPRTLSLLLLASCLSACDAVYRVSGHVVDASGMPVPKAAVAIKSRGCMLTNSQGAFGWAWIDSPLTRHVAMTVKRSGYLPYQSRIHVDSTALTIVMQADSLEPAVHDTLTPRKCAPPVED